MIQEQMLNRIRNLENQLVNMQYENETSMKNIEELHTNVDALQRMHTSSMFLGRMAVIAYDDLVKTAGKRRRETETEKRFRAKAGRHFGVEPSSHMHAAYRKKFPIGTGVVRSPSRSRSPSPDV